MAWLCAVLMVPLMLFIWALETKRTRINRYRSYGWSWKKIADITYYYLLEKKLLNQKRPP